MNQTIDQDDLAKRIGYLVIQTWMQGTEIQRLQAQVVALSPKAEVPDGPV